MSTLSTISYHFWHIP